MWRCGWALVLSVALLGGAPVAAKNRGPAGVLILKVEGLGRSAKAGFVRKLERTLAAIPGVQAVGISKKSGQISVRHGAAVRADLIRARLAGAGFTVLDPWQGLYALDADDEAD